MMKIRTYDELKDILTFEERFEYLKLNGSVGKSTFGFDRYLNQILYKSDKWKKTRQQVILRDNGCDLGLDGYDIYKGIIIHHMNPISIEEVERRDPIIFDTNYLICCSLKTHNAIHYGNLDKIDNKIIERKSGDTKLW